MNARVGGLIGLALALLILLSCSTGGGSNADDGNNPYRILDLRVTSITATSVTLKWTATGDDSSAGTASVYDMRVNMEPINNENWDGCYMLSGEPAPSLAGETDSMIVTGLTEDSTYYFALDACDEAGNCGGQSNCAQATCFNDYVITFPDTSLERAVRDQIDKPSGQIHRLDIMNMVFLDGNGRGIVSLTGLEHCTPLEVIFMNGDPISDLTPISGLHRLIGIQFTGANITDISPIADLTNLIGFSFRATPLQNIIPLTNLPNLHWMELSQTQITSLAPLVANSGIGAGDTLYLYYNPQLAPDSVNIRILESRGVTIFR